MAETKRMTADEVVGYLLEGEGLDFLRESLSWVVQLMEVEVSELIGAERGERSAERLTHRNGYRARAWSTRAGEIELAIPKIRRGSYFPSFLEPRKRSEQALVAVVQEAYVAGVSTRKVDQLVESLGLRISKSEVSRICAGLDEQVEAFRNRPLEGRYPYLWLDAKVEKVRDGGRVVPKALVLAYAVHESGYREVIALDVGEAETETEAFWSGVGMPARALHRVAAGADLEATPNSPPNSFDPPAPGRAATRLRSGRLLRLGRWRRSRSGGGCGSVGPGRRRGG